MQPLFTVPFPAADKSIWLAQVRKELKDENAGDSLRWYPDGLSGPERFAVDPYYTADDTDHLPMSTIQAAQKQVPGWLNAPAYAPTTDPKADNATLRDALTRGADALVLTLERQQGTNTTTLSRLLDGIKLSDTPVFFRATDQTGAFMTALRTVAPYQIKGGLLNNPLTDDSRSDNALAALTEATRLTADSPQFYTVCLSSHPFHNAGATAPQELAFILAQLADVYDQLTDAGLTPEQLIPKTILSVPVGTSYFMEIAKLRALRVLVTRFLGFYPATPVQLPFVHAQTSTFYDATATPYTNLLRATTEAMAAVVGGCDALTVHPYDAVLGQQTVATNREFPERIARNVSVLLKEESYFDKVADPSAGSYYIENLTNQLVEAAWALFLRVEDMGGFAEAVAQGFIQTEVDQAYQAKVEAVKNGKVLVGVNKFRFDEAADGNPINLMPNHPPDQHTALPDRRLAEEFE